jgi:hypothetical protein
MGARRDLRHHPAEGRVLIGLGEHDVGQDPAAPDSGPLDDRRGGLIAGRLDAEHHHRAIPIRALAPVFDGLFASSGLYS